MNLFLLSVLKVAQNKLILLNKTPMAGDGTKSLTEQNTLTKERQQQQCDNSNRHQQPRARDFRNENDSLYRDLLPSSWSWGHIRKEQWPPMTS